MNFGKNPQNKNSRKSLQSEPICPTGTDRRAGSQILMTKLTLALHTILHKCQISPQTPAN